MNMQQPTDAEPELEELAQRYTISAERYLRIRNVALQRQLDLAVVIENIHDPHNVSAIMRSADAVGISTIHMLYTREQFPQLNRAVSKGSQRWLLYHYWTQPEQLFAKLRAEGVRTCATAIHPQARSLYELDLTRPTVIVVGNEHRGVSQDVQALADERIFIPMVGMAQSLNVSVAAAIGLYEAMRQRKAAGAYDRDQPSPQQQELLEHWLRRERERHRRRNPVGRFIPR